MNGRGILTALIALAALHSLLAESNSCVTISSQSYWVEEVARGLTFPTAIAWLPNDDGLITERRGSLRILREGKIMSADTSGMPPVYESAFTGLKDIVVDPDYHTNGIIFMALSEGHYDSYHTAIYRAKFEGDQLKDVTRIFRSNDDFAGFGNGVARIMFLPDKTLLVAVPENNYYKQRAQQLSSHIGKIIRITRDGGIPSDNPFLGQPNALPEIWSYGHIVSAAEGILQRLGTGYIDILLLHAPHPLMQHEEVAKAFDDLHSAGKVRYFGVSNHDVFQTELLRSHCRQQLVVNQMWLGLARSSPIADRFALGGLVDYCRLRDMQIQAYSPLKGESIYKKPILLYQAGQADSSVSNAAATLNQVAQKYGISPAATMIAWLLRHPAGIVPIVGATKPEHLLDNCSADSIELDADDWTALWIASLSLNLGKL